MILPALVLSESGRAVLLEGEIEKLIANNVDLKFYPLGGTESNQAEKYKQGRLVLTSHRLLWIDYKASTLPGLSCWIPLSAFKTWEIQKSVARKISLKQEKVKLQIFENQEKKPAEGGWDSTQDGVISIGFKEGIPAAFETQLLSALADASWNSTPKETTPTASSQEVSHPEVNSKFVQQLIEMGFGQNRAVRALMATGNRSVPDAMDWAIAFENDPSLDQPTQQDSKMPLVKAIIKSGIGHIIKKEEARLRETNQSLDAAFQDLSGLMSKAQEMVKLAEKFRASLSTSNTTDDELLDQETITEMISMGIASPVTKETAGALYHEELSRQLVDFLIISLEKSGGMMTLPDVYCRFNRSRGMELISPDDLIQASHLFKKLNLPLKLRSFPSGVTVIQSASHDDEQVCQRIIEFIQPLNKSELSRPLIASDLVQAFNIPLNIAQEHLLLAEESEVLCRDDSHDGIRYFYNFFKYV